MKRIGPSAVRSSLDEFYRQIGFERLDTPADITVSGGMSRCFRREYSSGSLVFVEETYRHNWLRLNLDLGIELKSYQDLLKDLKGDLDAWDMKSAWYPLFQFGWSLGQANEKYLPYLEAALDIPRDVINLEMSAEVQTSDLIITFLGTEKALRICDETKDSYDSQLARVCTVLCSEGLSLYGSVAESGQLTLELFNNRWRNAVGGASAAAQALGATLCGRRDIGLAVIDRAAAIEAKIQPRLKRNFEVMRSVINSCDR